MSRSQRITALTAAIALLFAGAAGALFFAGIGSGPPAQTVQAQEPIQDRGISVQGEGQISVTPDIAQILLGVEVEGSDLERIRSDADERMNGVIDALQELGISEEDIQTVTYDIRVRDDRLEPPPPPQPVPEDTTDDAVTDDEPDDAVTDDDDADDAVTEDDDDAEATDDAVTEDDEDDDAEATEEAEVTDEDEAVEDEAPTGTQTYTIVQLVQVRITDIDMVGDVIDTALDAGANRVANIFFEVDDRQEAVEQAREEAVQHARQKAEHLAELTGVSVGVPLRIEESSPYWPRPFMEDVAMEADMAEDAAMARIEPGEQIITVTVFITYDIE